MKIDKARPQSEAAPKAQPARAERAERRLAPTTSAPASRDRAEVSEEAREDVREPASKASGGPDFTWARNVQTDTSGPATRTYEEDGVTYAETTRTTEDGEEVVRTYEQDGTSYTETTTTAENGDTTVVVEGVNGDVTETTTTSTEAVEGDIEEYVSEDYLGTVYYDTEAERGETRRSITSTTITDASQDPPTTTTLNQATSYTQRVELNPDELVTDFGDDGSLVRLDRGVNGTTPFETFTDGEVDWDTSESGQYLTYTSTPQGDSIQSETRLVGTGSQGQDVLIGQTTVLGFDEDGNEGDYTRINEERGTIRQEDAGSFFANNIHSDAPGFAERLDGLEGDYVNFRSTYTEDWDNGGEAVLVQELGDYDNPREDGRTVTSVQTEDSQSLSYRLVSEDGARVQEQTVVPGSDYSSVTETQYGENGEYTSENQVTLEGETVSETTQSRELVFPAGQDLPQTAPEGYSQDQWDRFRAAHPQGPVYRDMFAQEATDEDGHTTTVEADAHTAGSSQVGTVSQNDDTTNFYQLGGAHPTAGLETPEGDSVNLLPDGSIEVNGVNEARAALEVTSAGQALTELTGELANNPALTARASSLSRALGPASLVAGFADLANAQSFPESAAALGTLGQGLSTTLGTASRAGRLAGVVGGGLTAGVGIYELTQGEYAEGAADVVAGGAAIGAIALAATPAGPILLGVAAVATLVRFALDFGDEPDQAELEF